MLYGVWTKARQSCSISDVATLGLSSFAQWCLRVRMGLGSRNKMLLSFFFVPLSLPEPNVAYCSVYPPQELDSGRT